MSIDPTKPPASLPHRRRRHRRARLTGIAVLVVMVAAIAAWVAHTHSTVSGPAAAAESQVDSHTAASGGTYTRLDGRSVSFSAFRGQPVLVWFIADGCASCAASIPTVAAHLSAFTDSNTRVLALGLYGAFGDGQQASSALVGFAKAVAGPAFGNPAWTWGLASEQLTTAFDPDGVPDAYYLLDPTGRLVYRNSVPVSTISALLAHLHSGRAANRSSNSAPTPATTLP